MTILTQFRKEIKSKPGKASLRLAFQLGIRFALLGIVMLFLFISAVWIGAFGALPGKKALERIHHDNASLVYASDGSLIGKYYLENRHSIPVSSLPTHLLDALIAIEDVRFFEHSGVDYRSLGRVLVYTILLNKTEYGGGSTLSQQLAKNLYKRKAYGKLTIPVAKAKEIMIASRLEKVYDKKELLELYLNTVPFGENVYGIEAAALRFYSKKASDLSLEEGAVLIGLLKANTTYNPRLHPETSTKRRNVVLTQMYKYGYLDSLTYQKSLAEKIKLNYTELGRHNGTAPYFRDQVLRECKSILADLEILDGQSYNPYADGLKIYTTLDPKLQQYAEYAVREHMAKLQKQFQRDRGSKLSTGELSRAVKSTERYKRLVAVGVDEKQINAVFSTSRKMELFTWEGSKVMDLSPLDSVKYVTALMQIGFLAADPLSGHVLSWVGGIDHRKFGYDHVRARRQAGSTFKPVVFAAALESGQTPCDFISASRESYPDYNDWSPRNAGGKYEGYWSMSGALASSVNTVAVKVFMETGTNEVLNTARNLGFTGDLPAYPALALGAAETSLFELTGAYCAIAGKGRAVALQAILKIEDRHGNVLYTASSKAPSSQAMQKQNAEILIRMMQHAVDSGTASSLRRLYGLKGDIAGKTGTTQDHADGWFVGFTPGMVAGVWVGADNPAMSFNSLQLGQGAYMALPVWGRFMQQVQKNSSYSKVSIDSFMVHPQVAELLDCPAWVEELPKPDFFELLFERGKRYERQSKNGEENWFKNLFKNESSPSNSNKGTQNRNDKNRKNRKDRKRKRNAEPL